jgi:archaellum biogenesis ATPase FlaH
VTALDRQLDGGVPAGSLVAVESPAGAQAEPLAWAFMHERPTVYLPTLRGEDDVRADLDALTGLEEYQVDGVSLATPVDDASSVVELVDGRANVVVDPLDPMESAADPDRYVRFLNGFKRHLTNVGGVGVLLCTGTDTDSTVRSRTLSMADVVWELRTRVTGGSVESRLLVRKFRGAQMPDETIKIRLGERVTVDTSRDIA